MFMRAPAWMSSAVNTPITKLDRKSTRLNSSHSQISYAVFCLKKKNPKVRHFAQSHRYIVSAARGYPPSDVPRDVSSHSPEWPATAAVCGLDPARAGKAHVVGLSMGGFATLHLVLTHRDRVLSATIGGVGYGAQPEKREQFRRESNAIFFFY